GGDHVVPLEARRLSRRPVQHVHHHRAPPLGQAHQPPEVRVQVLELDAQVAAGDAALAAELGQDVAGHVDGNGEADALSLQADGGVDADHFAGDVHEGTAGIAGVDGGVGLDVRVERGVVDLPSLGGHDAHRHR